MSAVDTLSGRHLVVTGFTGFVAKVYVALLLQEVPGLGRITLLVRRRKRRESALERVERLLDTSPVFRELRARHGHAIGEWLGARLDVLEADIERPMCGLHPEALEVLASADVVVHCAGTTDFQPDPLKGMAINVGGALHAADLADRLGVPLVHVSTCYVAGNVGAEATRVPESLTPGVSPRGVRFDPGAEMRTLTMRCRGLDRSDRIDVAAERAAELGWPNIYTFTKALAEHALAQRSTDVTVVRPAIVECARTMPFPGWNEGLNTAGPLAWLISTAFRRLPTRSHHHFDVVPVDDVARGLAAVTAAVFEGRGGGVFQLASSDSQPLHFGRTVELTGLGFRRWVRQGGGDAKDQWVKHLDPVPVAQDGQGWLPPERALRWADATRRAVDRFDRREHLPAWLDDAFGDSVEPLRKRLGKRLGETTLTLVRVEQMLALFKPFIHDNDWVFETDRARSVGDGALKFDLSDLDWRHYWVDVEYPGLRRWCIPVMLGDKVAWDAPSEPALRLVRMSEAVRAASK